MLVGDMLISVPGSKQTELRLPSQPNGISIPPDSSPSFTPEFLRRKIFIVNEHLAVGAAGPVWDAGRFISGISIEFRHRDIFAYAEVVDFLKRYASDQETKDSFEQIGILIIMEAADRRLSLTGGNARYQEIASSNFGQVVAIGSGSSTLIEHVNRLDKNYEYALSQPSDGNTQFPEFIPLMRNLFLLAHMYWNEFASPVNLFEAWGGAYDLVYQDSNRRFQYLTDYTIFLRVFDVDRPEDGLQFMNILKYERKLDFSYITMLNDGRFDSFGARDITSFSSEPLRVRLDRDSFTMNSKIHISIIGVGKGGKIRSPLVLITGIDPQEQAHHTVLTWFDDEGRLSVAAHQQYDGWLQEQAMSYYRHHAAHWPK